MITGQRGTQCSASVRYFLPTPVPLLPGTWLLPLELRCPLRCKRVRCQLRQVRAVLQLRQVHRVRPSSRDTGPPLSRGPPGARCVPSPPGAPNRQITNPADINIDLGGWRGFCISLEHRWNSVAWKARWAQYSSFGRPRQFTPCSRPVHTGERCPDGLQNLKTPPRSRRPWSLEREEDPPPPFLLLSYGLHGRHIFYDGRHSGRHGRHGPGGVIGPAWAMPPVVTAATPLARGKPVARH